MNEILTPKEALCNPKSMKNRVCYPRCQDQWQNKRSFYKEESMDRECRKMLSLTLFLHTGQTESSITGKYAQKTKVTQSGRSLAEITKKVEKNKRNQNLVS